MSDLCRTSWDGNDIDLTKPRHVIPFSDRRRYMKKKREELGFSLPRMATLADLDYIDLKRFEAGSEDLDVEDMDRLGYAVADEIVKRMPRDSFCSTPLQGLASIQISDSTAYTALSSADLIKQYTMKVAETAVGNAIDSRREEINTMLAEAIKCPEESDALLEWDGQALRKK